MIMKFLIATIVLTFYVLTSAQGPPESCRPRKCSRIGTFENGIARGRRRVSQTVRFRCNPGYLLQGHSSLRCMCIDGQATWSNSMPICVNEGKLITMDTLNCIFMLWREYR